MNKDDQARIDRLFELFSCPGWKDFLLQHEEAVQYLDDTWQNIETLEDLHRLKGAYDIHSRVLFYEQTIRQDVALLEAEEVEDSDLV